MSAQAHEVGAARRSNALPAREVLRVNAYVSLFFGAVVLAAAVPLARITGIGRPLFVAIAGMVLLLNGFDALGLAVGRHLRRIHVLPFAIFDALTAAGSIVLLLVSADQLTSFGGVALSLTAVVSGWFAVAGFRSVRAL